MRGGHKKNQEISWIIKINKKYSLKFIQAYTPTTEHTKDEVENFYIW